MLTVLPSRTPHFVRWLGVLIAVTLAGLIASAVLPGAGVAATRAATTASACDTTGWIAGWNDSRALDLPTFDANLGRLTDIAVTVHVEATTGYQLESAAASQQDVVVARGGLVDVVVPGATATSTDVAQRDGFALGPYDGLVDHAGSSGATGTIAGTDEVVVVHPTGLAAWTASGHVTLAATGAVSAALLAAAEVQGAVSTSAKASACVTYSYERDVTACVTGQIWQDEDADGVQGLSESGYGSIHVAVSEASGASAGSGTTDTAGRWRVCGLEPAQACTITFAVPGEQQLAGATDGVARIACHTAADGSDTTYASGLTSPDVSPGSAQVSATYHAPVATALLVSISSRHAQVRSRSAETFTVWVRNPTSTTHTNVRVCSIAAPQFVFGARLARSTRSADRMCWTIGRLAPGAGRRYVYRMRAVDVSQRRCALSAVTVRTHARSVPLAASTRTCVAPR